MGRKKLQQDTVTMHWPEPATLEIRVDCDLLSLRDFHRILKLLDENRSVPNICLVAYNHVVCSQIREGLPSEFGFHVVIRACEEDLEHAAGM